MSQSINEPLRWKRGKAIGKNFGNNKTKLLMSPETGLSNVPLSVAAGDTWSFRL
jgi:hypothetical protein